MKKVLRIIAITSGIISAFSSVILCFIFFENILSDIKKFKTKFSNKIENTDFTSQDFLLK